MSAHQIEHLARAFADAGEPACSWGIEPERETCGMCDCLGQIPDHWRTAARGFLPTLNAWLAKAWGEGFDAGERDVFEHEQDGWADRPCIPNPYRKEDA